MTYLRLIAYISILSFQLCSSNYFQSCKIKVINRVIAAIFPIMISQSPCSASFLSELNTDINAVPKSIEEVRRPKKSIRAHAYSVEFTDPPCLSPRTLIGERGVLERLISSDSVIIGKHRGDSKDTELEINLLSRAIEDARSKKRTVAIGLTDIPNLESCQTAIDTYVSNKQGDIASADELLRRNLQDLVDEESVKDVLPVLRLARKESLSVRALGFNPSATSQEDLKTLIADPDGFVASAQQKGFSRYAETVLRESYEQSQSQTTENKKPLSLEEYVGLRLLSDETAATGAARFLKDHPDTTLALITDQSRAEFGYGLQERVFRVTQKLRPFTNTSPRILSLLLNPTPKDSFSPTQQLRLSLAYGDFLQDQQPLGNYLWYSEDPPVKFLTRLKNPVSREGDKPAGESSILGVF